MTDIQKTAEDWHRKFAKAFITSVSEGEPREYYIKVKFRTISEMHEASKAMINLAALCGPSKTSE